MSTHRPYRPSGGLGLAPTAVDLDLAARARASARRFRLGSSPVVHAPSIVVWARSLALTDPGKAAQIVADCWSIPLWAAQDLIAGRCAYHIDGETVVFPSH